MQEVAGAEFKRSPGNDTFRNIVGEKLLAELRLWSLCCISEAKHQQRQSYTSVVKTRVIVRGGMWLYNITEIMCVVL